MNTEIKLINNRNDRRKHDDYGDLYALLVTMEHLESAYVRGSIIDEQYTSQCKKLLAQYKTLIES